MAQFIFSSLLREECLEEYYSVDSAAVSTEEEGNDIYTPAKSVMRRHGIPFSFHRAHRITDDEFRSADLVVVMDGSNLRALRRRFGDDARIRLLLDRDVADPWYTDDFETAFSDIENGCRSLLMDTKSNIPDILSKEKL